MAKKDGKAIKGPSIPGEPEASDRIWAIRDEIQKLEDLKDQIVAYLDTHPAVDMSTRKLWIAHAKEAYYRVVAAWQMLSACEQKEFPETELPEISSRQFLNGATSGVHQVASELRSLRDAEGTRLEEELTNTFGICKGEILRELNPFLERWKLNPPKTSVIKVSDVEYHLPCSVCSKVSVIVRVGAPPYGNDQKLVFEGITHTTGYDLQHAKDVFAMLSTRNLKELHNFFKEKLVYEGIDAYCPDCDKIYCRDHYNAEEEFDDGFYDDTMGTCPLGHRRMIDD